MIYVILCQVRPYVSVCAQTEGSPAGADHALDLRDASGGAEETAGHAEGNAAQFNGNQTTEIFLWRSTAEPKLHFILRQKCICVLY